MASPPQTRAAQDRELTEAGLSLDVAVLAEEAGYPFIHLFRKYGLRFDPSTFVVTYLACLCSQSGLDGDGVLELLTSSGRLEEIVARLEARMQAEAL
jgi:hypothetical protein